MNFKSAGIYFYILLISYILVADFIFNPGRMVTHDYPIHLTMIAQFNQALKSGDFPVRWANGIANYGAATPIAAHQLTAYFGAFLYFLTNNVLLSGNLLFFISAFLSNLAFYFFLRIYFSTRSSLVGIFLFNFSSYRIFNIYTRGALPEFFSSLFVPLMLIGIYLLFIKKQKLKGFALISIASMFLSLNHPMMLLIYFPLFLGYLLFIISNHKIPLSTIFLSVTAFILGVGCTCYYLLPLSVEIKYLHYGQGANFFNYKQFLTFKNYFISAFSTNNGLDTDIEMLQSLHFGVIEFFSLIAVMLLIIQNKLKKRTHDLNRSLIFWFSIVGIIYIFMTLPISGFFYRHIELLRTIQFPWRFWSCLSIIAAINFTYLLDRFSNKLLILILIIFIALSRFPQLHGNNYQKVDQNNYFFSRYNPHSILMQTVWSETSEAYPVKKQRAEILKGKGIIKKSIVKNSQRFYDIEALENLRMIDCTFYFPGWKVYVDKKPVEIQFQDPTYRGVITYNVPQGKHQIKVVFENTKIRSLANSISLISIFISLFTFCILALKDKALEV
jgi:hypothetical protein